MNEFRVCKVVPLDIILLTLFEVYTSKILINHYYVVCGLLSLPVLVGNQL